MDKIYRVGNLLIMERFGDTTSVKIIVNLNLVTSISNFGGLNTCIAFGGEENFEVDSEWFEKIMKLWVEYVSYGS